MTCKTPKGWHYESRHLNSRPILQYNDKRIGRDFTVLSWDNFKSCNNNQLLGRQPTKSLNKLFDILHQSHRNIICLCFKITL